MPLAHRMKTPKQTEKVTPQVSSLERYRSVLGVMTTLKQQTVGGIARAPRAAPRIAPHRTPHRAPRRAPHPAPGTTPHISPVDPTVTIETRRPAS